MLTCPVPGCTRGVRTGRLMCDAHWQAVPAELRDAADGAFVRYHTARTEAARAPLLPELHAANAAAIAAAAVAPVAAFTAVTTAPSTQEPRHVF